MPKFEIGDIVQVKKSSHKSTNTHDLEEKCGKVLESSGTPYIEFFDYVNGHKAGGLGKSGHCWAVDEECLNLVSDAQVDTSYDQLLEDRGKTHGDYTEHAEITQSLKKVVQARGSWERLTDAQKEAMDMTFHKYGRILAGDPNFKDHWDDVIGYNKLVADKL